jgi:hypothetical protein
VAVSLDGGGADDPAGVFGDQDGVAVGQPVQRKTGGGDQSTDAGPVVGCGAPDGHAAGLLGGHQQQDAGVAAVLVWSVTGVPQQVWPSGVASAKVGLSARTV